MSPCCCWFGWAPKVRPRLRWIVIFCEWANSCVPTLTLTTWICEPSSQPDARKKAQPKCGALPRTESLVVIRRIPASWVKFLANTRKNLYYCIVQPVVYSFMFVSQKWIPFRHGPFIIGFPRHVRSGSILPWLSGDWPNEILHTWLHVRWSTRRHCSHCHTDRWPSGRFVIRDSLLWTRHICDSKWQLDIPEATIRLVILIIIIVVNFVCVCKL